jgi:hypothetical protein
MVVEEEVKEGHRKKTQKFIEELKSNEFLMDILKYVESDCMRARKIFKQAKADYDDPNPDKNLMNILMNV